MSQARASRDRSQHRIWKWVRTSVPTLPEICLVIGSALLLVLSFPNFDLWFLAWIGLVPLLFVVAKSTTSRRAFVAGWLWGTVFFYGTCWWLTYPMIHYAHISAWLAYPLLLLPIIFVALFPALACSLTARLINQFGSWAIVIAPLIWVSVEWLRYAITGQLWNALGYSQAFHPLMIQTARIGGVYFVTFLIVATSAAVAPTLVIGVQPVVPMTDVDDAGYRELLERHIQLSNAALAGESARGHQHRLVIWPESPMNFSYSRDPKLREVLGNFAKANHASILLNSLEP